MRTNGFIILAAIGAMACLGCGEKDSSREAVMPEKEVPPKTSELAKVKQKPAPEPVKPAEPPVTKTNLIPKTKVAEKIVPTPLIKPIEVPEVKTNLVVEQPVPKPPVKQVPSEDELAMKQTPDSVLNAKPGGRQSEAELAMKQTPQFALIPEVPEEQIVQDAYGALFGDLQLEEVDMALLKDVLVKRDIAERKMSAELYSNVISLEQMHAATKQIEERKDGFEQEIKTLLGDKMFAVYQSYEASESQRSQVKFLKSMIRDMPLSAGQEQNLVSAMVQVRNTFQFSHDYDSQIDLDPKIYTEDAIAEHFKEFEALQAKYLARAAAILSPEQLAKFKEDQQSRKGSEEMRIMGVAQKYRFAIPLN